MTRDEILEHPDFKKLVDSINSLPVEAKARLRIFLEDGQEFSFLSKIEEKITFSDGNSSNIRGLFIESLNDIHDKMIDIVMNEVL